MKGNALYFSGLNGLRAIAAIGVMGTHITLDLELFNLDPAIFGTMDDGRPIGLLLGTYGVSMFFALSGFLITYLLLLEKDAGEIDIKKFYLRRLLRIWPLYYLYMAIALITLLLFNISFDLNNLWLYLFFAANIAFSMAHVVPLITHYWSIGVEEQFYLFWPWIIKKNKKYLLVTIIALILLLLSAKLLLHFRYPDSAWKDVIHTSRFHCMLFGAAGALLYKQSNKIFLISTDNKITQGIAWFLTLLIAINKFHFASIIDTELVSIITLVIIIGQINIKNRLINLELNILNFLGKISYGIYVIHPLVIFLFSKLFVNLDIQPPYKYFIVYGSIGIITVALSYLSFQYFEKYFINLKSRFTIIKTTPVNPTKEMAKAR